MLADSHALWGAGLSTADYFGMWEDLADSRWGRAWYSWRAVVDPEGHVLSSLKLYRPQLRLGPLFAGIDDDSCRDMNIGFLLFVLGPLITA